MSDERMGPRPTLKDVAALSGVSTAAASYALRDGPRRVSADTRARVVEAARTLGYVPNASASSLRLGRTEVFVVVIEEAMQDSRRSTHVNSMVEALDALGYSAVLYPMGTVEALRRTVARLQPWGVLLLAHLPLELTSWIRRQGVTAVIGFDPVEPGAAVHRPWERLIGEVQARHLIQQGCTRLIYVTSARLLNPALADERLVGATRACVEAGVEPPVHLDLQDADDVLRDELMSWRTSGSTGLCAADDLVAMAAMQIASSYAPAASMSGRIIGADNSPAGEFAARPLTTVWYPPDAIRRLTQTWFELSLTSREARPATSETNWDFEPTVVRRSSS